MLALESLTPTHAAEDQVSAAALARKARSEALLRVEGVPVNDYLPVIEDETQVPRRSSDEIANRALALFADAKLRPLPEILEHADRIYRYRWALVDARLNGRKVRGLDDDVALERHQALNWLIGYNGAEWDDVTTDT
jgi:uncharacterized protein DUF4272